MSRVLSTPFLSDDTQHLAAPERRVDAGTRALIDRLEAEAYRRGHADGEHAAVAAATAAAERATAALRPLLAQLSTGLEQLRGDRVRADVGLAMEIAEHVVGAAPSLDAEVLADRVHAAVAELSDPDLEVRVAPQQVAAVTEALASTGDRHVHVAGDPAVPEGEARVEGRWGRAELTREAAMSAVRDLLSTDGGANDV